MQVRKQLNPQPSLLTIITLSPKNVICFLAVMNSVNSDIYSEGFGGIHSIIANFADLSSHT